MVEIQEFWLLKWVKMDMIEVPK